MKIFFRILVLLFGITVTRTSASVTEDGNNEHKCQPIGVDRADFFVDTTSTLPSSYGEPAQIDVHAVTPVYSRHCHDQPRRGVVLLHGQTIEATTSFDLQHEDFSVQEAMAMAGFHTYAMNILGMGLSSHFSMDDACSASPADQESVLIPNPLSGPCPSTDPYLFSTSAAMFDQVDQVVEYVRSQLHVRKVHLYGWSMGGTLAGGYSIVHPEKVRDLVLQAAALGPGAPEPDFPADPPQPLPQTGYPLLIRPLRTLAPGFFAQARCNPGQFDQPTMDAILDALRGRDPIGASWGPPQPNPRDNGVIRYPSATRWGFAYENVDQLTVPTLVISGIDDVVVPMSTQVRMYNSLGAAKKVQIKIECASHRVNWESSVHPNWPGGPHGTLHDATIQWMTGQTYNGTDNGVFTVHSDGTVDRL